MVLQPETQSRPRRRGRGHRQHAAFEAEGSQAPRAAASGSVRAEDHRAEAGHQAGCQPSAAKTVGVRYPGPRREGQSGRRLRADRAAEFVRQPLRGGEVTRDAYFAADCTTAQCRHTPCGSGALTRMGSTAAVRDNETVDCSPTRDAALYRNADDLNRRAEIATSPFPFLIRDHQVCVVERLFVWARTATRWCLVPENQP